MVRRQGGPDGANGETVQLVYIPSFLNRIKKALISAFGKYAEEIRTSHYGPGDDQTTAEEAEHDPRLSSVTKDKIVQRSVLVLALPGGQKKTKKGLIPRNTIGRVYVEVPLDFRRDLLLRGLDEVFCCNLVQEDLEAAELAGNPAEIHDDVPMRAFEISMEKLLKGETSGA